MSFQIPICSMMNAPGFFPTGKGSFVFDVPSILGIMGFFVRRMLSKTKVVFLETETQIPIKSKLLPILKHFHPLFKIGPYVVLQFHLFKFTLAKQEISRGNFVSESFAYLPNAKWNFGVHRIQYIFEINVYALGNFHAKIYTGGGFL